MRLIKTNSLTAAMQAVELLNSHGVPASRKKTARQADGCTTAVAVAGHDVDRAIALMRSIGLQASLLPKEY